MATAWQDNLTLLLEITHAPSKAALSEALGLCHTWFGKQRRKKYPAYLKGKTTDAFKDAFGIAIEDYTTKRIPAKVVEEIKTHFATYAHSVGGVGWSPPVGQTSGDKFAQKAWEHDTDEPTIEDVIAKAAQQARDVWQPPTRHPRAVVKAVVPRYAGDNKQIIIQCDDDTELESFTQLVAEVKRLIG